MKLMRKDVPLLILFIVLLQSATPLFAYTPTIETSPSSWNRLEDMFDAIKHHLLEDPTTHYLQPEEKEICPAGVTVIRAGFSWVIGTFFGGTMLVEGLEQEGLSELELNLGQWFGAGLNYAKWGGGVVLFAGAITGGYFVYDALHRSGWKDVTLTLFRDGVDQKNRRIKIPTLHYIIYDLNP